MQGIPLTPLGLLFRVIVANMHDRLALFPQNPPNLITYVFLTHASYRTFLPSPLPSRPQISTLTYRPSSLHLPNHFPPARTFIPHLVTPRTPSSPPTAPSPSGINSAPHLPSNPPIGSAPASAASSSSASVSPSTSTRYSRKASKGD